MTNKAKTFKEIDSEELCEYCPIPEEGRGVHCYGGEPIMCEGCCCDKAYENYLEEFEVEE